MRTKIGIFSFFALLLSFLMLGIVDDEGVGGDEDIGDFVIEDDEQQEAPQAPNPQEHQEEQAVLNKEIEELKSFKEQLEAERATAEAIEALRDKYPSFDANKIAQELSTIAKEQGEEVAERLNNPLGWENIYLKKYHKDEASDELFDRGRGEIKEPFDFKQGFEKAQSGDKKSIAALLEHSKG